MDSNTIMEYTRGIIVIALFSSVTAELVKGNLSESLEQATSSMTLFQENLCPPWFFYNTVSDKCECYLSPRTENVVKCTGQGALLRFGYCMTYKEGEGTFVSRCRKYFEIKGHNRSEIFPKFITLPGNISELNEYMCGPMNRKGISCSECIENFGPLVIPYRPICSFCIKNSWYLGVLFYVFLGIVPITIVYLIIRVFRIGLTEAPFTAFVLFSQIVSLGFNTNLFSFYLENNPNILNYLVFVVLFYGFWDFNFFFHIIPPFCVSPNLKTIHIVLLDYVVFALYPLVLICITWACIHLHYRNFKLFVWSWKKLSKYFKPPNKDSKSTLIDVFCTFLVLSHQKFVGLFAVSIDPVDVLNMNSDPPRQVLQVDPSMTWNSDENFLYLSVSFILLLVFVVPPILILGLYPTKPFRALCLKCSCSGHRRAALNIFVDKFYSSYRNGLDGGKDMRAFASLYFILRIVVYLMPPGIRLLYSALLCGGVAIIIATVRPYKMTYMNVADTLLLADLALCLILIDLYAREEFGSHIASFYALSGGVLMSIPMWGLLVYVSNKLVSFKKLVLKIKQHFPFHQMKLSSCCKKLYHEESGNAEQENNIMTSNDLDLPDCILNAEQYDHDELTHREAHSELPNIVRNLNEDGGLQM